MTHSYYGAKNSFIHCNINNLKTAINTGHISDAQILNFHLEQSNTHNIELISI